MNITPLATSIIAGTLLTIGTGCTPYSGSKVSLAQNGDGYTLIANGEPHTIYGAGGVDSLELLAEYGGNTIRTWDAEGIG